MRSHHFQDHTLIHTYRGKKVWSGKHFRCNYLLKVWSGERTRKHGKYSDQVLLIRERSCDLLNKFVSGYRSVSPLSFPREAKCFSGLKFGVLNFGNTVYHNGNVRCLINNNGTKSSLFPKYSKGYFQWVHPCLDYTLMDCLPTLASTHSSQAMR